MVVSLLMVLYCSPPEQVTGGSSSETVIGRVVNGDGSPAGAIIVKLYPGDYDPIADSSRISVPNDTTDSSGNYSIKVSDSVVNHSVVAISTDCGTRAMVTGIMVSGKTTSVPDAVLSPPGTVRIAVPDLAAGGYVFIPGIGIAVKVTGSGIVELNQVPAGIVPSVNYVSGAAPGGSEILSTDIKVVSGDTVVIPYPQWRYSAAVYLNTTVTGAGVSGKVSDFPILIRLNKGNFDFSQAQQDGTDIRFTKKTGIFLTHEIERWDPVAARAEIWVRVDTIYGDDSAQFISMYWGAPTGSATSLSSGIAVFDTANCFQGVWHLNDAANETVIDATVNQYIGVSPDTARPQVGEGVIGNCGIFDGNKDFITMPNTAAGKLDFPQNGKYSVSAWVMADTFVDLQQTLVSKGKYQYFLWADSTTWQFWEFQDGAGWETASQRATLKQWILLTGVSDGDAQYLYVNGEPADSLSLKFDLFSRNTESDLILGRAHDIADGSFFRGRIDEVRVESTFRGRDWIKLSYMNQRIDDRLIVYKR